MISAGLIIFCNVGPVYTAFPYGLHLPHIERKQNFTFIIREKPEQNQTQSKGDAMSEQKTEKPVAGLILIGKVNAKKKYQYKNGVDHFFLFIVSTGSTSVRKVEVKAEDYGQYNIDSPFKSMVEENVFNNQVTYIPISND